MRVGSGEHVVSERSVFEKRLEPNSSQYVRDLALALGAAPRLWETGPGAR